MGYLGVVSLLYAAVILIPVCCRTDPIIRGRESTKPKVLSDVDVASFEPSEETSDAASKKVVKRLAQVKNVFFGNADLLKEWLKGAGVTGQPGVDFPALTNIPATSFSCRGLKGGYYADLETNCQVFHICDNGRKISFLCPNGTTFQQSQLICDWWFKVDCSKSVELYEQSSEQLAEEERKRAESRKMKSKYHRTFEASNNTPGFYEVQNVNYDGKQNGRVNPYDDSLQPNQIQSNRDRIKSSRQQQHFETENFYGQELNSQRSQQQQATTDSLPSNERGSEKSQTNSNDRQPVNNRFHDNQGDKYATVGYGTSKKSQNYGSGRNSNSPRDEKVPSHKRQKFKSSTRSEITTSPSSAVTKGLPAYTESTTFRAGNSIKESQQFAESAAFVSNRRNRFNENNGNSHQFYNQLYTNRDSARQSEEIDATISTQDYSSYGNTAYTTSYRQRTTTMMPYETTIQFATTTETPPCNTDYTTEGETVTPQFPRDFQFVDGQRENLRSTASASSFSSVYNKNFAREQSRISETRSSAGTTPTVRNFETDPVRQKLVAGASSSKNFDRNAKDTAQIGFENQYKNANAKTSGRGAAPVAYRQESTSAKPFRSTQAFGDGASAPVAYRQETTSAKPFRSTQAFQDVASDKDVSPYDRSFTYKQGKIISTLGPYTTFKNPTTQRTTSTSPSSYSTAKSLIPKLKHGANKVKGNYLSEREHALGMLHSLRNLESNVPGLAEASEISDRTPASTGPSTLHSLALYFSTASDNFDSNETTDSAISVEYQEDKDRRWTNNSLSNETVQVPTSLLTQHTIASYAELFKLNNALETNAVNATNDERLEAGSFYSDEYTDDLDIQQSGGPLDLTRSTNATKLRELAQVFTHALSAYLLDPETFKKVLTEIRPTEPPEIDEPCETTPYPTTDYTSVTREVDEVLDFSDDGNELAKQTLTTVYPSTVLPPGIKDSYEDFSTSSSNYYTTAGNSYTTQTYEPSTKFASTNSAAYKPSTSFQPNRPTESFTAKQTGKPFEGARVDRFQETNQIRAAGFQNNSVESSSTTSQLSNSVSYSWNNRKATSKKPEQQLTPPFFENYGQQRNKEQDYLDASTTPSMIQARSTTSTPKSYQNSFNDQPYKVHYYKAGQKGSDVAGYAKFNLNYNRVDDAPVESTTSSPGFTTSFSSTGFDDSFEPTNQKETIARLLKNDHWTSSPSVTQLWETSVFVDPKRINHGLESETLPTTIDFNEATEETSVASDTLHTLNEATESFTDEPDASTPWQRSSRDKNPTAFTLLPTAFTIDNTATPKPLITTRSSITTTITSSVISTVPQEPLTPLLPFSVAMGKLNGTETEVAEMLFGKLNATSSNTLMRVMKQADNNETVRQLVLLLISHCYEPANRTMQREKEDLLNALLRMPIDEFTTNESKNVVRVGKNLPTVRSRFVADSRKTAPSSTTGEPSVTTFRTRKSRKFRSTTESSNVARRSDRVVNSAANSVSDDGTDVSDNRALELLRSLYTIATKWG